MRGHVCGSPPLPSIALAPASCGRTMGVQLQITVAPVISRAIAKVDRQHRIDSPDPNRKSPASQTSESRRRASSQLVISVVDVVSTCLQTLYQQSTSTACWVCTFTLCTFTVDAVSSCPCSQRTGGRAGDVGAGDGCGWRGDMRSGSRARRRCLDARTRRSLISLGDQMDARPRRAKRRLG